MSEKDAYNEALRSGQYAKPGGLLGKYDNVRRFWEDEELGLYLRPYLEELIARKKKNAEGLRVLDLGCGSGDGLELLSGITRRDAPVSEHDSAVIPAAMLERYQGIDINQGLLEQARSIYGDRENIAFTDADINNYDLSGDVPYDLYLANYGTLSHNSDEQTVAILSRIAGHAKDGALVLVDWLGRFSYEWQTLWTHDFEHNQWMNYTISYIYAGDRQKQAALTYFPLRLMARAEALDIYQRVKAETGDAITLRQLADRSSFVGRHMDTAQYNPHCPPLRRLVNSLFEPNAATDLDELLIRYVPMEGFPEINAYYEKFTDWWNHLVMATTAGLAGKTPPEAPGEIPDTAVEVLSNMKGVLKLAAMLKIGNPRASLVEPQLGYCLRELEMGLQQGLGCGHGLVALFEIVK
ncbi:MAG: class I SAM-dependent methyltransferase [Dehalococcoidales bacterium]|nr:class I SAM-dependent methyltransferase [Dehalococcoidales bacterium]